MITRQGRVEVLNDPDCRLFPWHPRPVLELTESNAVQLHEGPCLVLFVGEQLLPVTPSQWPLLLSHSPPTTKTPCRRTLVCLNPGSVFTPISHLPTFYIACT